MESEKKMDGREGNITSGRQFLNTDTNNILAAYLSSMEEDVDEEPIDNTQD